MSANLEKQERGGVEGKGSRPMWIIFLYFHHIIIKCQNVDKDRGEGGIRQCGYGIFFYMCFYPHFVDKRFATPPPPLSTLANFITIS